MKKNHCLRKFKSTIHRPLMLGTVLICTAGLIGCSKLASLSASPDQKQGVQNESAQSNDSEDSSDASEIPVADTEKSENEGNAKNPGASKKAGSVMEDGNLAALLGTSAKEVEQILGKYDGDLDSAINVGVLVNYPGLNIQVWNDTSEIYSVTLLDAENADWNIFDIRPGDSMDEAINHITSLGAEKEPIGGYEASEKYRVPYQDEKVHVELSNGGSGDQVDTVMVFFDVNDMMGIDVADEPGMGGMDGMDMFDSNDPHIAELQEKYPDALVSKDAVTEQIQYQDEWLEASVYIVDELVEGIHHFAFTPDGKLYQMEDGEWKPEN